MKTYPVVVSVAGSDSGGGAGIQADIKTISSLGLYAATVITAITAQNTLGVKGIQSVTMDVFRQQLQAVMDDFHIDAVKIGMLHSPEVVEVLTQALLTYKPKYIVLDPVMVATSGDSLIQHSTIESMKKNLFPLSTIITPNLKEASLLVNKSLETVDEMKQAAYELLSYGCKAVLVKGGHLKTKIMTDVLWIQGDKNPITFSSDYIETNNLHGTGCTLSSAIASYLALGYALPEAVDLAKKYVFMAIMQGKDLVLGHGHGPLNHGFNPQKLKIIKKKNV